MCATGRLIRKKVGGNELVSRRDVVIITDIDVFIDVTYTCKNNKINMCEIQAYIKTVQFSFVRNTVKNVAKNLIP